MSDKDSNPGGAAELRRRAEALARERAAQSPEAQKALSPEETQRMLHELRVHGIELEMQNEALRRAHVELDAARKRAEEALQREVVARASAEQALRTSEETARALMNASADLATILDPQGNILAANDKTAQSLDTRTERLEGSCVFGFFSPEVAEGRRLRLDNVLETRQPSHFQDERAGRTFDTRICPVFDVDGNIIRLVTFSQDITAHLEAEAVLRQSIERLELTQAAAGVGTWDWDIPSGRFEWSSKMFEIFGLDEQTTTASFDAWRSALHPEDRETAEQEITTALEAHSDLSNEYRVVLPDGQVRWINALGRGIYDEQGQPTRITGICLDITNRKRAEATIQRLSSFPQLDPNPHLEIDASGKVTFANPAATRTLEQLGLVDAANPFLPDDLMTILQELKHKKESGIQREVRMGSATFAETIQAVPASNVVRIYAFDITDRVHAEDALRASEEKYRLLFQNMSEGFALYELLYDEQGKPADWRVLEVNDAYMRHTGVARERIVGRRISEIFPAVVSEYLPRFAEVVATQTPSEFETYARAVSRHQRVSTFPAGGHRFASTIEDITMRKQSEEALRRTQAQLTLDAQKRSALEERQRLARELHDSVSQALYGISLGVNTALTLFDADRTRVLEALNYALSLAHAGLAEMRALIFELRPESLEMGGLVTALRKQVTSIRERHGIEVELSLCDEPDVPLAVKETVYRIAQEALHNAVKHAQTDRLDIRLTRESDVLSLEVCDNGRGFDPLAAHPGHLGLRSMRERAAGMGGTIEIDSATGCGTQIRVRIPVAAPGTTQPG